MDVSKEWKNIITKMLRGRNNITRKIKRNREIGRNYYWNLELQLKEKKKEKEREYIKHPYMNFSDEEKEKKESG